MSRKIRNTGSKKSKNSRKKISVNRTYKASLFAMIFHEKKSLLELYNALNGTEYTNPELLEINTLENAIYMSMKNDLSFIIDARLNLYEHQSTYGPNLPLRDLFYIADLYSEITERENLYGKKKIILPNPRFVIFYNGEEKRAEKEILKLSDLFAMEEDDAKLELTAVMLNINPGYNQHLTGMCRTLKDYSEYTSRVRKYAKELVLEDAVERAITECIKEGILSEFLRKNRAEAKRVSIYEYDEERHMRQTREEGYEEGREEGENRTLRLIALLLESGYPELVKRVTEDREFREQKYLEYGL